MFRTSQLLFSLNISHLFRTYKHYNFGNKTMNIDNSMIVLIAIYIQRDDKNIATFKQLLDSLPLEKSHLSQALAHLEKKNVIKKPEGRAYFSTIQITQEGISQAHRHIVFLSNLLGTHTANTTEKSRTSHNNSKLTTNFTKVLNKFISVSFSPLKNIIRNSLEEYIPTSHLNDNLLNDLTDAILDFLRDHVSTI
jgi:hypothetical protein